MKMKSMCRRSKRPYVLEHIVVRIVGLRLGFVLSYYFLDISYNISLFDSPTLASGYSNQ